MKLPAFTSGWPAARPWWRPLLVAVLALVTAASVALVASPAANADPGGLPGIDVSHYQGNINWSAVKGAGIRFAFIKATESTNYVDPQFGANYTGAYHAGVIRGAYHFGRPAASSGAAQANYFVSHGGAWSADNLTLPGGLDLEAGCAGLSQSAMVAWIRDFVNTYRARTGRDVVIYTTASWWASCTGGNTGFGSTDPVWVAHWGVASPAKPAGWGVYTFWQWTNGGSVSGVPGKVDRDVFNGSDARLLALANNT